MSAPTVLDVLERDREVYKSALEACEAKIAALRKPPEKFPIGTKAMVEVEVIAIDANDHGTNVARIRCGNTYVVVRESDLLPATPAPGEMHCTHEAALEQTLKERDKLLAQLPDGMKHCTIQFKECSLGHGWLTADNWIDYGCPTCAQQAVESELEKQKQKATPTPTVTRERIKLSLMESHGCDWHSSESMAKFLADRLGAAPEPPKPAVDLESDPYIGPMDPDEPTPLPWNNQDDGSITHPVFHDKHFGICRAMNETDYELAMECVNAKAAPKPAVSREAIMAALEEIGYECNVSLGTLATALAARLPEPTKGPSPQPRKRTK